MGGGFWGSAVRVFGVREGGGGGGLTLLLLQVGMGVEIFFFFFSCNLIVIDDFCIALFCGVHKLTALYNISNIFRVRNKTKQKSHLKVTGH